MEWHCISKNRNGLASIYHATNGNGIAQRRCAKQRRRVATLWNGTERFVMEKRCQAMRSNGVAQRDGDLLRISKAAICKGNARTRSDQQRNGVAKISKGYAMFCLAKEMPYSAKELYGLELQWNCMVPQWIGGAERCEGDSKKC